MSTNHAPSDASMRAWRLEGRFVCLCSQPRPERIGAFGVYECRQCRKPIIPGAAELIRNVLEAEA